MLTNKTTRYGWISVAIHWLSVVTVIGLTALGLWMVDLDYYDEWYQRGPDIHRSIGVLLAIVLLFRTVWRWVSPPPRPLPAHAAWEQRLSRLVHRLLLILLWAIVVAGYLISTADGRSVEVFDWFEVPALITSLPDQEDVAGEVHFILAMILLALAGLHALAALKHHFIDRDPTLRRMLGRD